MPTMNIFYQNQAHAAILGQHLSDIKELIATELTCGDIALSPNEVSIRFLQTSGSGMIAQLEVEITAHAFDERVAKQDEICLRVRSFLMELLPETDIRAWLLLPQLGHSWD